MNTKQTWLAAYRSKHKALFAYDTAGACVGRAGNSWASIFWAGFDGMTRGVRVPRRNTMEYSIYAAGKLARKNSV